MDFRFDSARAISRGTFFKEAGIGIGGLALSGLLQQRASAHLKTPNPEPPLALRPPMRTAKAKSIIYLHLSGAPPSLDMFDYKPKLVELNMQPCPESLLKGERFAFIKGRPKMLGSPYKFKQSGKSGAWV